jgi:hypothetical protein
MVKQLKSCSLFYLDARNRVTGKAIPVTGRGGRSVVKRRGSYFL